jgi:hypothetical protein
VKIAKGKGEIGEGQEKKESRERGKGKGGKKYFKFQNRKWGGFETGKFDRVRKYSPIAVTPPKAGVQNALKRLGACFRSNDEIRTIRAFSAKC